MTAPVLFKELDYMGKMALCYLHLVQTLHRIFRTLDTRPPFSRMCMLENLYIFFPASLRYKSL